MKNVVIPVDLGGSPTHCVMRPPRRKADLADKVSALIEHYQQSRQGDSWEVGFFHGGRPTRLQLEACGGLPSRLACSPADLTKKQAAELGRQGVRTFELEVLTFQPRVLRGLRRGYTAGRARTMIEELTEMGFRVGVLLSPGLPGFSLTDYHGDMREVVGLGASKIRFLRVNPALGLEGSIAAQWAHAGRWEPLTVEEIVPICRDMVDHFEGADIAVARLGLQPGQDVAARVVAGPHHPNLRGEVEASRFGTRLKEALVRFPRGGRLSVHVNPKDLSWVKGTSNCNIRALRVAMDAADIRVVSDDSIGRGDFRVRRQDSEGKVGFE